MGWPKGKSREPGFGKKVWETRRQNSAAKKESLQTQNQDDEGSEKNIGEAVASPGEP